MFIYYCISLMLHIGSAMNIMAAGNKTRSIQSEIVDTNLTKSENINALENIETFVNGKNNDVINYGEMKSDLPNTTNFQNYEDKNDQLITLNPETNQSKELNTNADEEIIEAFVSVNIRDGGNGNEFDEQVVNKSNGYESPDKEMTEEVTSHDVVTYIDHKVSTDSPIEAIVTKVPTPNYDAKPDNSEFPVKGEKVAIPATFNEEENLVRNNGGALTEFFHSYSISKEDDVDITISGEDKPVELMPLEDFLFITDQLLSGRKINKSERAMEEANVATDETVIINIGKSNKDDEVTTDSETSSSAFKDNSEGIELDFLSQLQSFNVLNEVIDGLDKGSETPAQDRTDLINGDSLESKYVTEETSKEKSGDLLSTLLGLFGF